MSKWRVLLPLVFVAVLFVASYAWRHVRLASNDHSPGLQPAPEVEQLKEEKDQTARSESLTGGMGKEPQALRFTGEELASGPRHGVNPAETGKGQPRGQGVREAAEPSAAAIEQPEERPEDLNRKALKLLKRAEKLSGAGNEEQAMEYERKALDLEARANDLRHQAEERSLRTRNEQERELMAARGEEPGATAGQEAPEELPEGVRKLRDEADLLALQVEALQSMAAELSEQGNEQEAMEYEQNALDLEAQMNDLRHEARELLSRSRADHEPWPAGVPVRE